MQGLNGTVWVIRRSFKGDTTVEQAGTSRSPERGQQLHKRLAWSCKASPADPIKKERNSTSLPRADMALRVSSRVEDALIFTGSFRSTGHSRCPIVPVSVTEPLGHREESEL